MKISVVMATYNGAEFIFDQLESLRNQKRGPDEVIIVDDASTDGTIRIMEEYIAAHRLENWSIHKNRQNMQGCRISIKMSLCHDKGTFGRSFMRG